METTRLDRRTAENTDLTPSQRSQRARIAARVRWSKEDGAKGTAAARASFLQRFEDEVDPDGRLSEPERIKRAEHARKAYFQRLAYQRHRKSA